MHRIVISGYYGFNNIGDESILKAVIDNLRERLEQIEITVLSKNPQATAEKYGVCARDRKSFFQVLWAVARSDLLISGGGSLLQDVTSKRSILYYLAVMWIALFFRKKILIYSQGIGPVNSKFNRRLMVKTLRRVDYIVVRDEGSREFLLEEGLSDSRIFVTADPVIRIRRPGLETGRKILQEAGFPEREEGPAIGIAIKGRKNDLAFQQELCQGIRLLQERYGARIVLIPFHFSEDMAITEAVTEQLENRVTCLRQKYLTEEMLSIIGNMDVLIGVRLHSLIHAAIMDVPMIGISYDPKVNSFMKSMGLKALCSVYDFEGEYLAEEYERIEKNREKILEKIRRNRSMLISRLNLNEELIKKLLEGERP